MQHTPSQREAIETLDRHLAVTAGPGSGKTRVLVDRYLHILAQPGIGYENIVAITFTKKAASEMRERLRSAIEDRIATTRSTPEEAVWRDRKRRLEGAIITTIHGFCSRLLREHPVEANLDPHFTTLDDYTQGVLLDEAVQASVATLIEGDDDAGARLLAAYSREWLTSHIKSVYRQLRELGIAIDDAEATTRSSLKTEEDYRDVLTELAATIIEGIEVAKKVKSAKPRERAIDLFTSLRDAFAAARAGLELEPSSENAGRFSLSLSSVVLALPGGNIAADLRETVAYLKALAERVSAVWFDVCSADYLPSVFGLIRSVEDRYSREKRALAALDYEDLQLRARDLLADNAALRAKLAARYRYLLVDEFQDTNGLQRDVVRLLGLGERSANVFIVGDRKQSIYSFRGAEVEVFSEAIRDLAAAGGSAVALAENFRSDSRLIDFQNGLFERFMRDANGRDPMELESLGFVEYERGIATRERASNDPAVELVLVQERQFAEWDDIEHLELEDLTLREVEANVIARRIREIVEGSEVRVRRAKSASDEADGRPVRYGDVAILLWATSNVKTYEWALQRAGVPYYVVAGKGFYDRPEVTDVVNLLKFVDNNTDELALAAVLRSPMFGISDDTLLALRIDVAERAIGGRGTKMKRPLYDAVRRHRHRDEISVDQHASLDEAVAVLDRLREERNRLSVSELISTAMELTKYGVVAASLADGPQRLSNLDKLQSVARQFERGGMRLLRDFVEFVGEFRRIFAREAEADVRTDQDAVAILTAHTSKGLEFPVVVIPDVNRRPFGPRLAFSYDRVVGLGFRVPDGRGGRVNTALLNTVVERAGERRRFEDQRLLYVAATRAEEYLLLSGFIRGKTIVKTGWLTGVLAECVPNPVGDSSVMELGIGEARVRVTRPTAADNIAPRMRRADVDDETIDEVVSEVTPNDAVQRVAAMLEPVRPARGAALLHLSATALQNYASCPRQFYYSRTVKAPELVEPVAQPDAAEDKEPGSYLPASLRGLVVHRFCETYSSGDDVRDRVGSCLRDVIASRGDAYSDVVESLDEARAIDEIVPFAENYVASAVRSRVEAAGAENVSSEQVFSLALEHGVVSGAIDKLVLEPVDGGLRAVVIDFKTGRMHGPEDFDVQMEAYAVAAAAVDPSIVEVETVLHMLASGPDEIVSAIREPSAARGRLERMLEAIRTAGRDPRQFPPKPGPRCRACAYAPICPDALR